VARTPPSFRRPDGQWDRTRLRRLGTRTLVVAVAGFVLLSIGRSMFGGASFPGTGGKAKPSPSSGRTGSSSPPTVDLNGVRIPANGQPVIVLNPGLVRPGATVTVTGVGFDAGSRVDFLLSTEASQGAKTSPSPSKGSPKGAGQAKARSVASATVGKGGTVSAQIAMPSRGGQGRQVVIAKQRNSDKEARAEAVSAAGVASMTISDETGRPGDTVTVTAQGFDPGEDVRVYWGGIAGEPAMTLKADKSGNVGRTGIRVGVGAMGNNTLFLIGAESKVAATAPFQILGLYPTVKVAPYAVKPGDRVSFSGSGFAPDERVLVYVNAPGDVPVMTIAANDQGSINGPGFRVPFGLKGKQSLIFIGDQSRATVNTGFSVLDYTPAVRPSAYGGLPGTVISFYATGFAPKEAVHVFVGGGSGGQGELVSAFRVDEKGSASAAGHYLVPGDASNELTFTLRGARSGGTATVTIAIDKPPQPVQVQPEPRYTLPPDLKE